MDPLTAEQIANNASEVFYFFIFVISVAIIGWTLLNWNAR